MKFDIDKAKNSKYQFTDEESAELKALFFGGIGDEIDTSFIPDLPFIDQETGEVILEYLGLEVDDSED